MPFLSRVTYPDEHRPPFAQSAVGNNPAEVRRQPDFHAHGGYLVVGRRFFPGALAVMPYATSSWVTLNDLRDELDLFGLSGGLNIRPVAPIVLKVEYQYWRWPNDAAELANIFTGPSVVHAAVAQIAVAY